MPLDFTSVMQKLKRALTDRRAINVGAMIGAYALGQGSIFIAQTYLLSAGQAAFLGVYGITFLIFSLVVQILDWGGQIMLARAYLMSGLHEAQKTLPQVIMIRILIAAILLAAFGVLKMLHMSYVDGFAGNFYTTAAIALLAMIINPAGILDGMQKAGVNGVATALPFIFLSISLMLLPKSSLMTDGSFLGLMYTLGAATGVAIQYAVLVFSTGKDMRFLRGMSFTLGESTTRLFLDGAANIAATMPGQFFFRGQVAAVSSLGMASVGAFIYVKQILTSAAQFSNFMRRAEIAQYTQGTRRIRLAHLFTYPSFAIAVASVIALSGLMLLGNLAHVHMSKDIHTVDLCFIWLAPTIITSAVASLLSQWVQLRLTIKASAFIMISTATAGIVFLFAVPGLGIIGAATCELVVHILQITLLSMYISKKFEDKEVIEIS